MGDSEARERARRRLEERQARMREEDGSRLSGARRPPQGERRPRPAKDASGPSPVSGAVDLVASALRAIGPRRLAIAAGALAVLILLVALVVGVRGCLASNEAEPAAESESQAPAEEPAPREPVDEAALAGILGDELAAQLVQAAETSEDAAWIAAHPDEYAMDGQAVQYKLLKLAAVEPEARAFVRGFPEAYPAEEAQPTGDPEPGEVPRLYQWDPRWASTVFSSTTFALTGCCPTSLAMVYQGLTGKGDLSPYDMALRARQGGYETTFDGTDQTFLLAEAASLGLSCQEVALDETSVRAALADGAVLVCNVGPGDFTDNGHFFVVTGIDEDGNLAINDPYSAERSKKAWSAADVLAQTKGLWAYRRA